MNKKRLIITSVISIILVSILFIGTTYSVFTTGDIDENANVYTTGNLNITYTLSSDNVKIEDATPVATENSIYIKPYRITVTNSGNVAYKFNVILNDTTASNKIDTQYVMTQVGKLESKALNTCTNSIIKDSIVVEANSSVDVDVRVWLLDTIPNSEIGKNFYAKLSIDGLAVYTNNDDIDNSDLIADYRLEENSPNLDSGNLIPVYYDDNDEVWKKADSSNAKGSWYNYRAKKWANAILVSDATKRSSYQSASVGTTITDADISAFYVWIPRFKYKVWNITRQAGTEDTYAYSAYTNGIEISFENDTESTGNVTCTYNTATVDGETNLSDTCVYNGTDTITTTSGNYYYTDAWYTHPAFTFGGTEKTGFWIGKFETTGTASAPTILPDVSSLRNQIISDEFTTSKVFQTYGLSSNIDAHMLTNLEWGAVAYLTHSVYGLCGGGSCRDAYINNSGGYYTGRSGGALAGSTDLNLANVYPSDSTSTNKYNSTGYYTYKGYFIDYSGNVTTTKDSSKVASTTGNVYGVYDMVGGTMEYVMGNMVNSANAFYTSSAGTNWNGSSTLDSKYYNAYSYSESNYYGQAAFNRARLGDATAENTGSNSSSNDSWKPGTDIIGVRSGFVSGEYPWICRGCWFSSSLSSLFYFDRDYGDNDSFSTFRSSLS